MPIHQDWRAKITDTLRLKRNRLSGDYIQRNLDHFGFLLPRLRRDTEVVMQRRDISDLTKGAWSEASVGKFLKHLQRAGILTVRSAGSRGLGITLRKDLSESPWSSRRSDTGKIAVTEPTRVEEPKSPLKEEVEFDPMPSAQPPVARFDVPEDDDYCTDLDLDMTLAAIDTVAQSLIRVDLNFAKEVDSETAAKLYDAQAQITTAVRQLEQIRSAIGAGDDSDLKEIIEHSDT